MFLDQTLPASLVKLLITKLPLVLLLALAVLDPKLATKFDLADCEEDRRQFHVSLTRLEPKVLNFSDLVRYTKNI